MAAYAVSVIQTNGCYCTNIIRTKGTKNVVVCSELRIVATQTVSTNPQLSSDEAHLYTSNRPCLVARQLKIAMQHAVQLAVCGSSCVIGGYDVSSQHCSCTFFKAFKLPCRHIFNYRAVCRVDVTDLSHVPDRSL